MTDLYASINCQTSDRRAIIEFLNEKQRRAWVSPHKDGYVCVFDELCEPDNIDEITKLALALSNHVDCPVLAMINSEDSLAWYQFYKDGKFGGSKYFDEELGSALPETKEVSALCKAFGIKPPDEVESNEELIEILSLPVIANCLTFRVLERDQFELEFEDLADEELDINSENAHEFLNLDKLGWIRTDGSSSPTPEHKSDAKILYWTKYRAGATSDSASSTEKLLNHGLEMLERQEFKSAISSFNQTLESTNNTDERYYALHNRAVAKAEIKDIDGAIADLLAVLKVKPDCERTKALLTVLL